MKNYLLVGMVLLIVTSCRINPTKNDNAMKNKNALDSLMANKVIKKDTAALLAFLGEKMYKTIELADSIQLYVVSAADTTKTNDNVFSDLKFSEQTGNLDSLTAKQLKAIVLNPNNFSLSGRVKNCGFVPDMLFRFAKGKDTVNLFLCFYCDTWKFQQEKNIKFDDSDNARSELVKFAKKVFPKNKKVAGLKPKRQIKTENDLITFFGERTWQKIKSCKQANAFLLDAQKKPTNPDSTLGDFAIIAKYGKLKPQQFAEISSIVRNPESYSFDNIVKSCAFVPDIGIEFITEGAPVRLYISYYCDTWVFDDGRKQYTEDCETARSKLVDFAKALFPEDRVIKRLK